MKIENIGMSDFDVWENLSFEDDVEDTPIQETSKRRKSECLELSLKYLYKRAHSESSLLDCIGEFKENHSYNFITSGDIDSLSFLKLILRHQNLEYLLFSTWCMSAEDILQLDEWIEQGKIIKMDAYVGEIFPGSYKIEYDMLKQLYKKHSCGRIVFFKNHSKIFTGKGDKFAFGIQTSANINTNPRTENACITINNEIYNFYKTYFDDIKGFK